MIHFDRMIETCALCNSSISAPIAPPVHPGEHDESGEVTDKFLWVITVNGWRRTAQGKWICATCVPSMFVLRRSPDYPMRDHDRYQLLVRCSDCLRPYSYWVTDEMVVDFDLTNPKKLRTMFATGLNGITIDADGLPHRPLRCPALEAV